MLPGCFQSTVYLPSIDLLCNVKLYLKKLFVLYIITGKFGMTELQV